MRKQNKEGTFSEYQWEIINFVKTHQGMRYSDIQKFNGWPPSTVSGTIIAYERQTGERIGVVGTKPRKTTHEPSILQQKIIEYLLTHPDDPLTDCAEDLDVNISYVSMTAREYVPSRHRVRPKKYGSRLKVAGEKSLTVIPCLCCGLPFPSRDKKTNRLCYNCNSTAVDDYEESYAVRL